MTKINLKIRKVHSLKWKVDTLNKEDFISILLGIMSKSMTWQFKNDKKSLKRK